MTPDPAQVAAQITGCRPDYTLKAGLCAVHGFHGFHFTEGEWPCSRLADATEVIRAALEQQRIHTLEQAAADLYADTGYAMAAQWLNERASYPTPKEEAP